MVFRKVTYFLIIGSISFQFSLQAQHKKYALDKSAFASSEITWKPGKLLPEDIRMDASSALSPVNYFTELKHTFLLPAELEFIPESSLDDRLGNTHVRYRLHYKGLEVSHAQYILHQNKGRVYHGHGKLIHKPELELRPKLSQHEAYLIALKHLGINEEEARQGSKLLSTLSMENFPEEKKGKLLISAPEENREAQDYRLVYSFDITTIYPFDRYDVEIDAHTGDLVDMFARVHSNNIPTSGLSLYYDTVDIIVSDSIGPGDWPESRSYWQLNDWNAYQDSGMSWWLSDTTGLPQGGYGNNWHQALSTEAIILSISQPELSFYHRYALESPEGADNQLEGYDGYDGFNVRISNDGAKSWSVLKNPEPAYTCSSLWSFGNIYDKGKGIPGWAGRQEEWVKVIFNLSEYQNDTVLIRFEFASDGGWSSIDDSTLFGWQIDDISIGNADEVLYLNTGDDKAMSDTSLFVWGTYIEGKYRLRESTRGNGIITLDAGTTEGFSSVVDFVQDSLPIMDESNRSGVGIHWASERSYDYFLETFNRNSFDNQGGSIISYADWRLGGIGTGAFWAGSFAAYGPGFGNEAKSFGTLDIVGHEFTHGVTWHSAGLIYSGESGALNESFSDIFATAIEFYVEGEENGDWNSGEDRTENKLGGYSLENPKRDNRPDTYKGNNWVRVTEEDDFGGVHTNSGVQNHWFYLLCEGGSGINDYKQKYSLEGIGIDAASAIAYRNLTTYLMPDSKYHDAARYAIQSAMDLYGEESPQVQSTLDAWEAVGVYLGPKLIVADSLPTFSTEIKKSQNIRLRLANRGSEPLTVYNFYLGDTANFSITPLTDLPRILGPGETINPRLSFKPDFEGSFYDTLIISNSDAKDSLKTVYLSGTGIGAATYINASQSDLELAVQPNPFEDHIIITFKLAQPDYIRIELRDLAGRLVYQSRTWADGKGSHEIAWNSPRGGNQELSSGVYLLSLRTSEHFMVRKIIKQ